MFCSKTHYLFNILKAIFPPKRIWNGIKSYISYLFSKKGIFLKWNHSPLFMSVEPSNICNLHCPECPVGIRTEKIKTINIDKLQTKKTIDALSPYLTHLIFYFQGEPFMNPSFLELVKYARSKNILTSTSTNAQLIDYDRAKEIIESGLDRIIISIDGTSQETYEKYRIGGKLEKAIGAINHINAWKKKLKKTHPFIEIQFIVMRHNEHQINKIKLLAKKLKADKLSLKSAQIYDFENGSKLIPSIEKYSRYKKIENNKYTIKSPLRNSCKRLWMGAVLNSRGELLPCCFDKNSEHSFGNVYKNDIEVVWNGDTSTNFRKNILLNRKQYDICRNCSER